MEYALQTFTCLLVFKTVKSTTIPPVLLRLKDNISQLIPSSYCWKSQHNAAVFTDNLYDRLPANRLTCLEGSGAPHLRDTLLRVGARHTVNFAFYSSFLCREAPKLVQSSDSFFFFWGKIRMQDKANCSSLKTLFGGIGDHRQPQGTVIMKTL